MSIKDIITRKPRWQHSDPEVRIEAISAITDQEILDQLIADDPEEKVRCAAVSQLADFQELSRLAMLPGDIGITARSQFCRTLQNDQDPESGVALIGNLEHVELLKAIAVSSNSPDITLLALEKLRNEDVLVEVACTATTTQAREAAANKIQSVTSLETLQKQARHKDKLVHNIAKTRLQDIQNQALLKQQNFDAAEAIINELRQLPNLSGPGAFDRTLNHLQAKWDALEPEFRLLADATDRLRADQLTRDFNEIIQQCQRRMETLKQELEAEAVALASARSISEKLETMLKNAHESSNSLDEQRQTYDELTRQWHSIPHLSLPADIKEAYYGLISKLEFLLDAHKRWSEIKAQLPSSERMENADGENPGQLAKSLPDELVDKVMKFHWPDGFPAPDDLTEIRESISARLAEQSQRADERKRSRAEIEEKLDKMEREVKSGHLRAATKMKRQVFQLVNDLNDHHLHDRLQRISAELTELRDWQGFATNPKREELCLKMEELAGSSLQPQDRADRIKELHAEWKALGDSHTDQKHWHRFKQASDLAYEPCKIYFQQQAEERAQRLEERRKICEQLEEFNKGMDWESVNWKVLMEIITTARKQWRDLGPVDHGHRKNVQNRFYKVIDALNSHLTAEQDRNQELKKQLIEEVTLLLDEEKDLSQVIRRTIELQKQWKQIGIMDRRADQKLWKKFRKACDAVFNRRDEQKQTEKNIEAQRVKEAEAFCQSIEDLAKAPLAEVQPSKAKLIQIQSQFQAIELSPPTKNKLERRFTSACDSYQSSIKAFARQKQLGSIEELARRASICQQLEAQIEAGEKPGETELEARWTADGDLPHALLQRIEERWKKAKELINQPAETVQEVMKDNAAAGRLICIRMEILAEIESPEQDQQLRMSYQVDRLKKELSLGEKELRSMAEQFKALQDDWYCLGGIPAAEFNELNPRIEAALKKFNG